MIASVRITKCYDENAKNFGLANLFMLSGGLRHTMNKVNQEWPCTYNYPQSRFGMSYFRKMNFWGTNNRSLVLFVLFIFPWVYGFFAFNLQFRCSYLRIFNILGAILLFYFVLTEIYTTPSYFIYIFVSIVTQHMVIYESFVW